MTALITTVFKATISFLVQKGRAATAEKFEEGDVINQKFRRLIVREIDDLKSKLDGLAKKDLLSSVISFAVGIEYLYDVFEKSKSGCKYEGKAGKQKGLRLDDSTKKALENAKKRVEDAHEKARDAFAYVYDVFDKSKSGFEDEGKAGKQKGLGMDDSTKKALENAKKKFEDAREKARDAFANEALNLNDRLLAMEIRVMATILQAFDNHKEAIPACKVCIEELHSLTAVKECFTVELGKAGFSNRFSKDDREKIISAICQLNRFIYDFTLMVGFGLKEWPCVDTGKEKIDPIRDERLTKLLGKQGMKHCFVKPWSFGQDGEKERQLKSPVGIATNPLEHFIVADDGDKLIKVFDSNGNFQQYVNIQTNSAREELYILDIAADKDNNFYVLVGLKKLVTKDFELEVHIFSAANSLLRKFPVKKGPWGQGRKLAICSGKVLVLRGSGSGDVVEVYRCDGKLVRSFGGGFFKNAGDIAAINDRVIVMDTGNGSVHIFTLKGKHEAKVSVDIEEYHYFRAALHPTGNYFILAGFERLTAYPSMAVFSTTGEFVRRIQLSNEKTKFLGGMAVTKKGQVALVVGGESETCRVSLIAL